MITPDSKVLIQGITQQQGSIYTALMKAYGTHVVAGVSAGDGGQMLHNIPVFDLVEQAISAVGTIDIAIVFVPPYEALDASLEAISAGIPQIILATGGVPPLDMVRLLAKAKATATTLLGSGSSGIIVPGKVLLGTQQSEFYTPGSVGLISREGTLIYEVALELTQAGLGQSVGVSLGSDGIVGSSYVQWLQVLADDENTKAIVLIGQTGGRGEEAATDYIAKAIDKPVVAYIAGLHAPLEKRLGDADVITISQLSGSFADVETAQRKIELFKQAKIPVAKRPSQIPKLVKKALDKLSRF